MENESFGSKVRKTTKKVFRILLITILIVGITFFSFMYWGIYDEGVRAGNVLRISKKGMLFKTYEGQLNLQTFGGLKNASPLMESCFF